MIPLIAVWFKSAEGVTGPGACGEVVTREIAGGVVMKAGSPAFEGLTGVRKHAKHMNSTAETSFARKKERRSWSTHGSVDGSIADLVIVIMSAVRIERVRFPWFSFCANKWRLPYRVVHSV